jgi:hypothetical protein
LENRRCSETPLTKPYFHFNEDGRHLCLKVVMIDVVAKTSSWSFIHTSEHLGKPKVYLIWTRNSLPPDSYWRGLLENYPQYSSIILCLVNIRALQDFLETVLDDPIDAAKEDSIFALYHALMSPVSPTLPKKAKKTLENGLAFYLGIIALQAITTCGSRYAT